MTLICQKCHKSNPGNYYEIITGDPAFDSDQYPNRRTNHLTGRVFANFRGDQVYICDKCCVKAKNKETRGFLWLGALILLACSIGSVLSLIDMIEGKNLGFYGTAGTILILLLIPLGIYWMIGGVRRLFNRDFTQQHAEAVAWAVKQKQEKRDFQTIWTRTNFEACFGANLQPDQRANITDVIPMTKKDQ